MPRDLKDLKKFKGNDYGSDFILVPVDRKKKVEEIPNLEHHEVNVCGYVEIIGEFNMFEYSWYVWIIFKICVDVETAGRLNMFGNDRYLWIVFNMFKYCEVVEAFHIFEYLQMMLILLVCFDIW